MQTYRGKKSYTIDKRIPKGVSKARLAYRTPHVSTPLLILILITAISVPFIISAGTAQATSPGTHTITTMEAGTPYSADPATAYDTTSDEIVQNVYETLFYYNGSDTTTPAGVLATGWDVSAGGLTYTIYLRSGVKFQDGTDFNASAVKYSFDRGVIMSQDPWQLVVTSLLKGGNAYLASGKSQLDANTYLALDSVHVVNDTCVQIALEKPYSNFIDVLTVAAASIVSPSYDIAHGGYHPGQEDAWMDTHACGTGPFKLDQWSGSCMILTKNADYWKTPAWADTVNIAYVNDYATRLEALVNGSADFVTPSGYNMTDYDSPSVVVDTGNVTLTVNAIGMNFRIAPFNNPAVRQAFAESFNTSEYIQDVYGGYGVHINGPLPPGVSGYDSTIPGCPFNATHAKELLVEAGYSSASPTTIAVYYNAGNNNRLKAFQILKQQVESYGVGITLNIQALDYSNYSARLNNGTLPMLAIGWMADYSSADNFLNGFAYSGGYIAQRINYANSTVDADYNLALFESEPGARQQLYDDIVRGVDDDYAYIWTVCPTEFQPHGSGVKGYTFNAMNAGIDYYGVYKETSSQGGISLSANKNTVTADGNDNILLTAYVTDPTGSPVSDGTQVTFTVSGTGAGMGLLSSFDGTAPKNVTVTAATGGGYAMARFGWTTVSGSRNTVTAFETADPSVGSSISLSLTPVSTLPPDTIVSMEYGQAVSMDYQTDDAYDAASQEPTQMCYEALFYFNGSDFTTPVPVLATGYGVSADGLVYTIYLRPNVTFHDGTAFNASAVKY